MEKTEKKIGRPLTEISQEQFEKLCWYQCTLNEIAGFFNCSQDTVERWCKRTYDETFEDIYKKKSEGGKISLRRMQFKLAKTNSSMAIFLGKQYLGQRDYIENETINRVEVINDVPDKDIDE